MATLTLAGRNKLLLKIIMSVMGRKLARGTVTGVAAVFVFAMVVVLSLVFMVPEAWVLMLALGAIHSFFHQVPAFSFWVSYLLYAVGRLLFGRSSS